MSEKFDKTAVLNWITGGCKNFCVNGHLTRNCHYLSRRRNDCKQRIERQFAGRLQESRGFDWWAWVAQATHQKTGVHDPSWELRYEVRAMLAI